jgi:hypothetical protein
LAGTTRRIWKRFRTRSLCNPTNQKLARPIILFAEGIAYNNQTRLLTRLLITIFHFLHQTTYTRDTRIPAGEVGKCQTKSGSKHWKTAGG